MYTCMHIIPCVSFISIFIYSYLRVFTYIFSSFFRWFFKLLFINFPLHGQWCPPWCSFSARPSVRFWLFPRMTKQCPSTYHKQDLQRKKKIVCRNYGCPSFLRIGLFLLKWFVPWHPFTCLSIGMIFGRDYRCVLFTADLLNFKKGKMFF